MLLQWRPARPAASAKAALGPLTCGGAGHGLPRAVLVTACCTATAKAAHHLFVAAGQHRHEGCIAARRRCSTDRDVPGVCDGHIDIHVCKPDVAGNLGASLPADSRDGML